MSSHENEIANLQKEWMSKLDGSLSQLQSEADSEVRKAKRMGEETQHALEKKMMEVNRDYILVSKHLDIVHQKETSLNSQLEWELNNLRNTHHSEKDILNNRINTLEQMNSSLSKEKDELIVRHGQDISGLRHDNADLTVKHNSDRSAIEEFNRINNSLTKNICDLKQELEKTKNEGKEIESKLTTLKRENEILSDQVKENQKLKAIVEHNEGEIFSLKKELDEVYKDNETKALKQRKMDLDSEAEKAKYIEEIRNTEKENRE